MSHRKAVRLVGVVLLVGVTAAGCTISDTHHRPGTSHDVATEPPPYDSYGNPVDR